MEEWLAPLTESQLGLVVIQESIPVPGLYNIVLELRLAEEIASSAIEDALKKLLEVQPSLRMALKNTQATLISPINSAEISLRKIIADGSFDAEIQEQKGVLSKTEFNLNNAPLIRATHVVSSCNLQSALLLVVHHAVFDGASIQPLIRDFNDAIAGILDTEKLRSVREVALHRELNAQQRSANADDVEVAAREISARISDLPPTILYPRPSRPKNTSFVGARRRIGLSPGLNAGIDRVMEQLSVTPFTFFAGIFAAMLSRHADASTAIFGVPVASRRTLASYDLCGFFVNTLPFIAEVSWELKFADYIRSVIAPEVDSVRRSVAVPFTRIARHCSYSRESSRNPLFSTMLAMQDSTIVEEGRAVKSVREHTTNTAKFDLWLGVTPTANGWLMELEYDTELLPQTVIDGIHDSLLGSLEKVVANSNSVMADIFNNSSSDDSLRADGYWRMPGAHGIYAWLAENALKYADRVAVEDRGISLTYQELLDRTANLASGLYERRVRSGDVVGLTTSTLSDTIVAMLAVLRLRAIFLPLDLSLPAERLQYMTMKTKCRIAIGGGSPGIDVFAIESLTGELPIPESDYHAEDGVYVMFTSGSTGNPKGVLMHNTPLVNLTAWQMDALSINEQCRFLQYAPLGFDVSFQEIIPTLVAGGTLVSRDELDRRDLPAIVRHAQSKKLTHIYLPVAALRSFIDAAANIPLPDLRYLCVSGEQLIVDGKIEEFFASNPILQLVNLYGPTETHAVTTHRLSAVNTPWSAYVPIGIPITGVTAHVVDRTGHLAPRGVVGELLLGGRCPAKGYINDPERTAERFVEDPYIYGEICYRTGDQVLRNEDGKLLFLGRNDHQIKIRGYRVEPGEVEGALRKHPLVAEATVLALGNGNSRRLIGYVVAEPEEELAESLRTYLADRLPDYMVPSAIVRMDRFPLTANGKVNQKLLPEPEEEAFVRQPYQAPEGEIEQSLAKIWSELLGLARVSRSDNFFELGGHSLLAMQVVSRLAESGIELPLSKLFASPTLSNMAEESVRNQAPSAPPVTPIKVIPRNTLLPLSFAQQRLWLLAQFEGGGAAYHIPMAWRIVGRLDVKALHKSLNLLVSRHEVLRSFFVTRNGQPWVGVTPIGSGFELIETDLRATSDQEAAVRHITREEAQRPFNLSQGPLIRAQLIQLDKEAWVFLLTQHHIVSDGWSFSVLLPELRKNYEAIIEGRTPNVEPLHLQYADYASWQRDWLSEQRLGVQREYWRNALKDAPALIDLPCDYARPALQSFVGGHVPIKIDRNLTRDLTRVSIKNGATLFMTVLAAWSIVLNRLSGQDDLVIGTPTANRRHSEVECLIGFFVNMLALRIDLSGYPDTKELIARVKEKVLEAQENQDLPFEQVVEIVQPPRCADHTPLFQVIFVWENADVTRWSLPGLDITPEEQGYDTVKFDLELSLALVEGEIVGTLDYSTALYSQATMERHVGYLRSALQAIAQDETSLIGSIEIVEQQEREMLLYKWNENYVAYPDATCAHHLFERQAEKSPDAIAIIYEDIIITYGELNSRANRLAHELLRVGVGPDSLVAICMERSPALLIGLLAVLKAGGAYVPLDPDYPAERLKAIIEDCAPVAIITDTTGRDTLGETIIGSYIVLDPNMQLDLSDANLQVVGLTSNNLCYVIYTSGSTGKPKGVMVEHVSVVSFTSALKRYYEVTESDRFLLFASISFDVSVEDIFLSLTSGASLVLRTDRWLESEHEFAKYCALSKITYLNLPTAYFIRLALAQPEVVLPQTIRIAVFGGEASYPPALESWFKRVGHKPALHNAYGPTEATVDATLLKITPNSVRHSIGRPISNTRVYLLDMYGSPVPLGAAGELYIGGPCVARGYLNRPDITNQVFLNDPFSKVPGSRMYKTGDIARYLQDGSLIYLGRNDHQVKIRGFRIELGEIEERIAEHPDVIETSVFAVGDEPDRRLIAYVISQTEQPLANSLRSYLSLHLPEYMVPAAFVKVKSFPLTPNGKIDRTALPSPDQDDFARQAYLAPEGDKEKLLAETWQRLLKVEKVGRSDNFFSLGGHSLLAVQVVSQLASLGYSLSLNDLFHKSTLESVAASIYRVSENGHFQGCEVVRAEGSEPPIFFVPSGLADYSYSYALAPSIQADCPIYALPWPVTEGGELPSIADLAAAMTVSMQRAQPKGPYRVLGYSAGGVLAYAIGQALSNMGHDVGFIGIIDGAPPCSTAVPQRIEQTFFDDIVSRAASKQRAAVESLRKRLCTHSLTQLIEAAQDLELFRKDVNADTQQAHWKLIMNYERNVNKYKISAAPIEIHLFCAEQAPDLLPASTDCQINSPTLNWESFIDPSFIVRISVPGNHYSMVEDADNRALLGNLINSALSKVTSI